MPHHGCLENASIVMLTLSRTQLRLWLTRKFQRFCCARISLFYRTNHLIHKRVSINTERKSFDMEMVDHYERGLVTEETLTVCRLPCA